MNYGKGMDIMYAARVFVFFGPRFSFMIML